MIRQLLQCFTWAEIPSNPRASNICLPSATSQAAAWVPRAVGVLAATALARRLDQSNMPDSGSDVHQSAALTAS